MRKIIPLLLTLGICLWAADFWQTKPYTDWSDKEIQKIETNSPWSKEISVSVGEGGGGSSKGGKGNRAGNTSEVEGAGNGISGGGNAGRNAGIQDVGGGAGGGASIPLVVSWRSSLVFRQAVTKSKFGAEAATSADAKKMVDEDPKFYILMISGLPGRALRANDKAKESLLKVTSLSVKGKDPLPASDLQIGGNEQRPVLVFLFPKTAPLSLDDKDVEFSTKLGPIVVKQKFHLKDMVFNGKLDL